MEYRSTDDSGMECDSHHHQYHHQPPCAPLLCIGGCGFYSTSENIGYCSKCYTSYLKQKIAESEESVIGKMMDQKSTTKYDDTLTTSTTISDDRSVDSNNDYDDTSAVIKNRCESCNKKLGLLGFECKCGGTYCGKHRYAETHSCNIDFKRSGKIALQKQNPVCKADKISERV